MDLRWYILTDPQYFQYFNLMCEFTKAAILLCDLLLLHNYTLQLHIYAYIHIYMYKLSSSTLCTHAHTTQTFTYVYHIHTHINTCAWTLSYTCIYTIDAYTHIQTLYTYTFTNSNEDITDAVQSPHLLASFFFSPSAWLLIISSSTSCLGLRDTVLIYAGTYKNNILLTKLLYNVLLFLRFFCITLIL